MWPSWDAGACERAARSYPLAASSRSWAFRGVLFADQSSRLSARNVETRSAIWTLFKPDMRKCVLPLMPISGRCTTVTSPACLLTVSRQSRAIRSRVRQLSYAGRSIAWSGMLSP